jgi:hypothetical protein
VEPAQRAQDRFQAAYTKLNDTKKQIDQFSGWMRDRYYWVDVFKEIRQALMQVEADTKSGLGADVGVWIESMNTFTPGTESLAAGAVPGGAGFGGPARATADVYARYGMRMPGAPVPGAGGAGFGAAGAAPAKPKDPNAIDRFEVTFRAVSPNAVSEQAGAAANQAVAYEVASLLKSTNSSNLFDPTNTVLDEKLGAVEESGTFTFKMNLFLKRPLRL